MRLVPDWRSAHIWWSIRLSFLGAAVQVAWESLPADLKTTFPDWTQSAIAGVIFIGILLGRVVDQPNA